MGLPGVTLNRSEQRRRTQIERGAPGSVTAKENGVVVFVMAKENGVAIASASSLRPMRRCWANTESSYYPHLILKRRRMPI